MSSEAIATVVGLAVFFGLRLIDYLLPKGRHFSWVDRFTHPDDPPHDDKE